MIKFSGGKWKILYLYFSPFFALDLMTGIFFLCFWSYCFSQSIWKSKKMFSFLFDFPQRILWLNWINYTEPSSVRILRLRWGYNFEILMENNFLWSFYPRFLNLKGWSDFIELLSYSTKRSLITPTKVIQLKWSRSQLFLLLKSIEKLCLSGHTWLKKFDGLFTSKRVNNAHRNQ